MTRKRKSSSVDVALQAKRRKVTKTVTSKDSQLFHPVLSSYYGKVCTLRQYILESIPNVSRRRRQLLNRKTPSVAKDSNLNPALQDAYKLLDEVLVGVDLTASEGLRGRDLDQNFQRFTQQLTSSTASSILGQATVSHAEV